MITEQKLAELAAELLKRSRESKVTWTEAPVASEAPRPLRTGQAGWGDAPAPANAFVISLPNSRIRIRYKSPRTEPDSFRLELLRKDRQTAAAVLEASEGDEYFEVLRDLFSEANRVASGWDVVLADVEQFLHQETHASGS